MERTKARSSATHSTTSSNSNSRRGSMIYPLTADIPTLAPSMTMDHYEYQNEQSQLSFYKTLVQVEASALIKEAALKSLMDGQSFEKRTKKSTTHIFLRLVKSSIEYREGSASETIGNHAASASFELSSVKSVLDGHIESGKTTPKLASPRLKGHNKDRESRRTSGPTNQDNLRFTITFNEVFPIEETPAPLQLKADTREQYVIWVETLRHLTETGTEFLPETKEMVSGLSDLFAMKILYGPPEIPPTPSQPPPTLKELGLSEN